MILFILTQHEKIKNFFMRYNVNQGFLSQSNMIFVDKNSVHLQINNLLDISNIIIPFFEQNPLLY